MKEYGKMKQIFERADQGIDYGNDRHKMSEEKILKDAIDLFRECAGEIKNLLLPIEFYLGDYDNQVDLEIETEFEIGGDFSEEIMFKVLVENVETDSGIEKAEYDFDENDGEENLSYYNICLKSYISTSLPKHINMLIDNVKNNKFEVKRKYDENLGIGNQYLEQIKKYVISELEDTLHSLKHYTKVL